MLSDLAGILHAENPAYISALKANLKDGRSYAKSRELALTSYLIDIGKKDQAEKCASVLKMPNSILAVEYLIALKCADSKIEPSVLLREGAGYHESSISCLHASAASIRNTVTNTVNKGIFSVSSIASQLSGSMPAESLSLLLADWSGGIRPVIANDFYPEAILAIRAHTTEQLDGLAYMGDQLSHRLKNAVDGLRSCTKYELQDSFKSLAETKRYAGTRINRALISLLCGQTNDDLTFLSSPEYLRILGFSDRGRYLLRLMRKTASLPQIDKTSDFLEYGKNRKLTRMAELDLLCTDIWGQKAGCIYGDEYERSVIHRKARKNQVP